MTIIKNKDYLYKLKKHPLEDEKLEILYIEKYPLTKEMRTLNNQPLILRTENL